MLLSGNTLVNLYVTYMMTLMVGRYTRIRLMEAFMGVYSGYLISELTAFEQPKLTSAVGQGWAGD
jgi:hypothetical protein